MTNAYLFAVHDRKAQTFLPIFQAQREATAVRSFNEALMNPELPLNQYPSDFDLVRLGSIDTDTGVIEPENPALILNGLDALTLVRAEAARYAQILKSASE